MFAWILLLKTQILGVQGRIRQACSSKKKNNQQSYGKLLNMCLQHLNNMFIVMDYYQTAMMITWKTADIFSQNSSQLCLKTLCISFFPLLSFISALCAAASWEMRNVCVTILKLLGISWGKPVLMRHLERASCFI